MREIGQLEIDLKVFNALFDSVYAKVAQIEKQIKGLEKKLVVQRNVVEEVAQLRDGVIERLRGLKEVPHKESHEIVGSSSYLYLGEEQ